MYLEFESMPAHARIWVYQADRKFKQEELVWVKERLAAFCEQWNTHGALMPTSFTIKFDQVIILSVDESQLGASGCSIDSSVRTLREIEEKFGVNLLDQGKVGFLESEDNLSVNSVFGIKESVNSGVINSETKVLNPLVKEKGDLHDKWLIEAKESWLNKYFRN
ncbi:hypothetical protein A33Q_4225 [Indibacter alkaliphilus LW1]|jgi:hypothetical protein|uniref:ABC transporter ATPase n=1 Tax=Indibacter alkaliphilus (strain CCUG 57479 / KCTC 22604 / LW1) TaxID=1189612 RepID=S2CYA0_INDAL|nr:hypothetical protein [Indibacter alkaliphilus]EOZ92132.1 hypothetical protein A33Q_4225 [Indibacter alkaliphilus LW1]